MAPGRRGDIGGGRAASATNAADRGPGYHGARDAAEAAILSGRKSDSYRTDGGTVRGTVEDCGGATVVLAPQDPNLQYPDFIRRAACQQNGWYEITGLRPGEYYAFAFDSPPGVLDSASFACQWMNQALR